MRRTKPEPKEFQPDIRFQSVYVTTMIHHMLRRGKKTTAVGIMYDALDMVQQKTGRHPIEVLDRPAQCGSAKWKVRPRRVGGATTRVPMEVRRIAG
jgi:small subunit ribosomal protein S7